MTKTKAYVVSGMSLSHYAAQIIGTVKAIETDGYRVVAMTTATVEERATIDHNAGSTIITTIICESRDA